MVCEITGSTQTLIIYLGLHIIAIWIEGGFYSNGIQPKYYDSSQKKVIRIYLTRSNRNRTPKWTLSVETVGNKLTSPYDKIWIFKSTCYPIA